MQSSGMHDLKWASHITTAMWAGCQAVDFMSLTIQWTMPLPAAGSAWAQLLWTPTALSSMECPVSTHMWVSAHVHERTYQLLSHLRGIQAKILACVFLPPPSTHIWLKVFIRGVVASGQTLAATLPSQRCFTAYAMQCAKMHSLASRPLLQGFKKPQTPKAYHTFQNSH